MTTVMHQPPCVKSTHQWSVRRSAAVKRLSVRVPSTVTSMLVALWVSRRGAGLFHVSLHVIDSHWHGYKQGYKWLHVYMHWILELRFYWLYKSQRSLSTCVTSLLHDFRRRSKQHQGHHGRWSQLGSNWRDQTTVVCSSVQRYWLCRITM